MSVTWFVVAAAVGGVVRHGVNRLGFAWRGTLTLNVLGALALGVLLGSHPSDDVALVLGTAFCGSLTTFSMFTLETVEADGRTRVAIVAATVVGTITAAATGYLLA